MQTFLPYPSFEKSAKALDYKRLGKQRLEAKQILNALMPNSTSRWRNHPAVKMWKGYEKALKLYYNEMVKEWIRRGYKNSMSLYEVSDVILPHWLGNSEFHSSHRSNLLRKNYDFYCQYGWIENLSKPYIWPK